LYFVDALKQNTVNNYFLISEEGRNTDRDAAFFFAPGLIIKLISMFWSFNHKPNIPDLKDSL